MWSKETLLGGRRINTSGMLRRIGSVAQDYSPTDRMKVILSAVAIVTLLAKLSRAGYTNFSEVPLYGLSPPVYPTRKH